jgi:hypothetical protein
MTHLRSQASVLACRNGRVPATSLAPLISGTQEWLSRCSSTIYALNKHWFELLQKRVQEDFALPQHIMSCRTPVEVWSVYIQFLQKAVTDCQNEFAELGRGGS